MLTIKKKRLSCSFPTSCVITNRKRVDFYSVIFGMRWILYIQMRKPFSIHWSEVAHTYILCSIGETMNLFTKLNEENHEQLMFCTDPHSGLQAIICIHSTSLGPAIGGIRFFPYPSEQSAIQDALRLSKAMTYKSALAGLNLGGGNAVIIGENGLKSEALFRSFGRYIESLNGRFIGGEDMNTTVEDMNHIRNETRWVLGSSVANRAGKTASMTAYGVVQAMRACLEIKFGRTNIKGKRIAIQGVGSVGFQVAKLLHEQGAELLYYDLSRRNLNKVMEAFPGTIITDDFYETDCDILSPCAVGGVLNQRTIPRLKASIIVGAANNQLEQEESDAELLKERGILYATDYAVNSGGLISVAAELSGSSEQRAKEDTANIFNTIKRVVEYADTENVNTWKAANHIAEQRMKSIARLKNFFL